MTVPAGLAREQYAGAGSAGPFAFNHKVFVSSHLKVTKTVSGVDTLLVLTTDYSVSIATDFASASITLISVLAVGQSLTVVLDPPIEQQIAYSDNDPFPAATHERALDLGTMVSQALAEKLRRAPLLRVGSPVTDLVFPDPVASALIGWNSLATALENKNSAVISGTVIFPGSSLDNALIRFDGTTGSIVQNSGVLLGDDNAFDLPEISVPTSPAANRAKLYSVDDGAGITTLAMKDGSANVVPLSHFKQTGTGAVTRAAQLRFRDAIWAADYGVTADGTTDDTTAMQNAINAAIANGVRLWLPGGNIKLSAQLTVPSSLTMIGMGRERTVFVLSNATQNGINISANDTGPCYFQGFGMTASVTHTAGSGIVVDSSGAHINYESRFVDLRFVSLFHGMDFERAAYWVLDGCAFENCRDIFLIIKNLADVDAGDAFINNCLFEYFNTVTSANILLYWESSGGLKVANSKFAGGFRCMHFNLASGAGTGSNIIDGCSVENFTDSGILIAPATGSPVLGTLRKFGITGNEIGGFGNSTGIKVSAASTPTWFKGLTIAGNTIANSIDGTGTTGKGIDLDFVQEVAIVGNTIRNEGPVGTTVGVNLGSNCSVVSKLGNVVTGFNVNVQDASTSPVLEALKGGLSSASPTQGIGYATGAGAQVTQATNKGTGVIANGACGEITMNAANLAANTTINFVVTCSAIAATDQIDVKHVAGGTNFGSYLLNARPNGAGSFAVDVRNITAGALAEAIVLGYTVIKRVNN